MDKNEKKKRGRLSRGNIFSMCAILLCCALVFVWAGITFLPDSESKFRREIVNDDYDSPTVALDNTNELSQSLYVEGKLYGVRLLVSKTDADSSGTVSLSLFDEKEVVAATAFAGINDLSDGLFYLFLFESPVDAPGGSEYTLSLTAEVNSGAGVSFMKSSGEASDFIGENDSVHYALSGFKLIENGQPQSGTLALQYITRYSGRALYVPYIILSIILLVFFELVYLALFVFRVSLHFVFLFCSLILGTVFLLVIPLRTAPDEYVHIANAYRNSNIIFGIKDSPGSLTVRAGDEMFLLTYDYDATDIFAYQDIIEDSSSAGREDTAVIPVKKSSRVFPLMYLPQTLGVVIARLLGLGKSGLLFMGRFLNLIFYSVVVMFAVKKIPFMKTAFMIAALLPMSLQLAASFSYDTYVIALCFLFISLTLELAYKKEKPDVKDLALIIAVALLIAPAKTVYLPVLLLLLIPASEKLKNKKTFIIITLSVFAAAVMVWTVFNFGMLKSVLKGIGDPYTEPLFYPVRGNNDAVQRFTFTYIFRHIPQTLLVLSRTFYEQGPLWLQGLIGGRLGEIIAVNIEINWLVVTGLILLLAAGTVPADGDDFIPKKKTRLLTLAISAAVFALLLAACLSWTPINYDTLFGMQGRYLLPVLPLFLLSLRGNALRFTKRSAEKLVMTGCALTMFAALQAFLIIIQR